MNEQTKQRITKEAEDLFPIAEHLEKQMMGYKRTMRNRKIYIKGATAEAERSEKLREALEEVDTELASMEDYLHGNDGYKISTIRNKINSALNQSK